MITPEDIADGERGEEDSAGLKVDAETPGAEVCFLGEVDHHFFDMTWGAGRHRGFGAALTEASERIVVIFFRLSGCGLSKCITLQGAPSFSISSLSGQSTVNETVAHLHLVRGSLLTEILIIVLFFYISKNRLQVSSAGIAWKILSLSAPRQPREQKSYLSKICFRFSIRSACSVGDGR